MPYLNKMMKAKVVKAQQFGFLRAKPVDGGYLQVLFLEENTTKRDIQGKVIPGFHDYRQTGAALITSLIFLTVLTILGMSTLGTALLESRMSGNARDRNMAFQTAEIGLRDAELYIRDSGRIVGLNEEGYDTGGVCDPTTNACDAQICKFGLCYNGGTMAASGAANAWYLNGKAVWLDGEIYWANALQYAHDSSVSGTAGKKIVGISNVAEISVLNAATGNCGQIPGSCNYAQPGRLPLVRRQPEYLIEAFQKNVGGSRFYYRITVRGYGMRSGTRIMLQEVYTP
ncbi:MAG: PilX N-terminal domain-containing pilus assembly protein [Gallionellaceae bacterium]|nr:PilX N-terminal domain-containing pilus assembly protein [Gallionellaceae bacterium]